MLVGLSKAPMRQLLDKGQQSSSIVVDGGRESESVVRMVAV